MTCAKTRFPVYVFLVCCGTDPNHPFQVRIKGYAAIVDVSREQNKWVKRNADVLVQLLQSGEFLATAPHCPASMQELQSTRCVFQTTCAIPTTVPPSTVALEHRTHPCVPDEPEEVTVVKRALTQHLDMDPVVTLGVLCDQIVPPDEPLDDEEQNIRDRLRSLVLAFLAGEAKRPLVERHANALGSPAEQTLVTGLFKVSSRRVEQGCEKPRRLTAMTGYYETGDA